MKNKIDVQIKQIQKEKRVGIMTHIVIGYPSIKESMELLKVMIKAKVDFIELQIPFSDPMADGPTIMKANKGALENGVTIKDCMNFMAEASKITDIPLLFMGYYNLIYNYGVEKFMKDAKKAGAWGLIFPDIPLEEEEYEDYLKYSKKYDLYSIRVLSPASNEKRIKKNAKVSQGFVYFVARKGITGAKKEMDKELKKNINKLKKHIKIPIAVGFGISSREQVKKVGENAEIAVIGSAVLDLYKNSKKKDGLKMVGEFIEKLKG